MMVVLEVAALLLVGVPCAIIGFRAGRATERRRQDSLQARMRRAAYAMVKSKGQHAEEELLRWEKCYLPSDLWDRKTDIAALCEDARALMRDEKRIWEVIPDEEEDV